MCGYTKNRPTSYGDLKNVCILSISSESLVLLHFYHIPLHFLLLFFIIRYKAMQKPAP